MSRLTFILRIYHQYYYGVIVLSEWENDIINVCEHLNALSVFDRGEVIGIGTGRTIKRILQCLDIEKLSRKTLVPSSLETLLFLKSIGLRSAHPAAIDELDLYIDGADYANRNLELIKGGGAALTTEKLLASASRQVIIVIDHKKLTDNLLDKPIPLEVIPHAISIVKKKLSSLGLKAVEREPPKGKRPPVISDIGGAILDLDASAWRGSLKELEAALKGISGVVETGLFIDLADILIVGHPKGVYRFEKKV